MNIRPLSKELQEKAKSELNEVPERIKDDIEYIKQWLSKQPHLKAKTEDQWLLAFLRGCKFSLERTKEKIDMYYTARTIAPEFYEKRDPFDPEIQELLKLGVILPLRKAQGPGAPKISLLRPGVQDATKFNINKMIMLNWMFFDITLNEDDQGVIAGLAAIQDLKDMTMGHMAQLTTGAAKKSMIIFQESMPVRPKQMHYLNMPSFFDTILQMMKPFMKEKLQRRMVFHSKNNLEELYKYVPKDILPVEYGGTNGTLQELTDYWKEKVESYRDWFLDDQKYKTDESKRLGKPKTGEDVFGIEGSFRKLNVD